MMPFSFPTRLAWIFGCTYNHTKRYAGVDASHPVPQRVHTRQLGVGLSHVLEGDLASLELVVPELAAGPAHFDHEVLGVLSLLQHGLEGVDGLAHRAINKLL